MDGERSRGIALSPAQKHFMKTTLLCLLLAASLGLSATAPAQTGAVPAADPLARGFAAPPESTKPWCYWYWISDNISKEGITRDLEAMHRVGIGEAFVGNIFLNEVPAGPIKVFSPQWWELVEHAIREGGRVGVNVGLFNCPGWSQSGGPWIKPEQTMRFLVSSETRVHGPTHFAQKLPTPREPFQEVAVQAFPAPEADADSLAAHAPRITCAPATSDTDKLIDGQLDTALVFPSEAGQGKSPFIIELECAQPFTARSLALTPGETPWAAKVELLAADASGKWQAVRSFKFDRSNMALGVGPMPRGPVEVSFAPVAAQRFRLVFTSVTGHAALAELNLSPAARVESFVEKQLGKMHPTPLPLWDTYLWPTQAEPTTPALTIPPQGVIDLSRHVAKDGTLQWDVPPGDWVILRTGMTPTGMKNSPASPEGQGLEVDKMNRAAARAHFEAFIGQVLKRLPARERTAFKRVVADSYEMGPENWTDGFAKTFRQRYHYDPTPWLPVLSGRLVGSADQSDRFLWDLRRLVADHVATDYVGGLREACHEHGLQLWLENYGHWGFPSEFLKYGGNADLVSGEYWVTGELGSIELRAASSCANTYGKPRVSAESFTGGPPFQSVPASLKARGDWSFCEGVNHVVLHVYIHQPWEDRVPGINAPFGTEFNRHNTWFDAGKAWIDYERRACFLLQQGWRVADVAYFIGEDAPKMTGVRRPELPAGRDFDYINADILEQKLSVKNGVLTLPHGTSYRVLVLPELDTMRPELLRKVRDLVEAGATVIGPPPLRSPSLQNFPHCDQEVRQLANELWGAEAVQLYATRSSVTNRSHALGKGRVLWGVGLEEVLKDMGIGPDFQSPAALRYTHRAAGDTHIYFVTNPKDREVATTAAFRAPGLAPELWNPDSGAIERAVVYDSADGVVRMPLHLGPHGSVFVVFRHPAENDRVVSVARESQVLLDAHTPLRLASPAGSQAAGSNTFTLAVWVKPAADTTLLPETNQGVHGMNEPRNDVAFAPHGNTFGSSGQAGSGLAVGRNGVVVFEHAGNYFAPVLVQAVPLTNWAHVAVVYRQGQPSLYVNGVFVHRGLTSPYTVHPPAGAGGGNAFRGELGDLEQFPRALSETELTQLMKTSPAPDAHHQAVPLELSRSATGTLQAVAWESGHYTLTTAAGQQRTLTVPTGPESLALTGPWEVQFNPAQGPPVAATFNELVDWTQRPEEAIQHYSGKAVYRKTFEVPESLAHASGSALFLDLGQVHDLATVRLNGQTLRTLWLAPWRVDVTAAIRPGKNLLEIEVVNAWNNRLVGDKALPVAQRHTFLALDTINKSAPLFPAGLRGPVTLQAVRVLALDGN
jgi:hypothetical protein